MGLLEGRSVVILSEEVRHWQQFGCREGEENVKMYGRKISKGGDQMYVRVCYVSETLCLRASKEGPERKEPQRAW